MADVQDQSPQPLNDDKAADPEELQRAEALARLFHETYEALAPAYGYATRKESAVPWAEVPSANRSLMVAVAGEVLRSPLVATVEAREAELADARRTAEAIEVGASIISDQRDDLRERLAAATAELADAHAVIRRALGSGKPYAGDVWFDMEDGNGVTAWRLANTYPPRWQDMTPGEAAAIARARTTPEGTTP